MLPQAQAVVGPSETGGPLEPHAVMLLKTSGGSAGFCSGVVVAPRAVLTAAHCVTSAGAMRLHYRGPDGAPVLLPVSRVAVHPENVPDAKRRHVRTIDMALVEAAAPLPARFAPATLDNGEPLQVGDALTLTGFGLSREREATSAGTFRAGPIAVRAPLSRILLWANDAPAKGVGACTGDSGGPIFLKKTGAVVAISAWADGEGKKFCGALTQGVLVAPQRGWIEKTLREWEE